MNNIPRISTETARQKVTTGTLLVCGYEDEQTFLQNRLAGAISYQELLSKLPSLSKDTEIIFYCA